VRVRFSAARWGRAGCEDGGGGEAAATRVLDASEVKSVLDELRPSRESDVLLLSATSIVVALCTGGLAASSMLSGLADRSTVNPFSNGFSPDMSAGPVTGPKAPSPWAPVPS